MPNITDKLNAVIDHIESRLPDEPDEEEIARICGYSYNDVSRIFAILSDITITEYIRKRRLTLAGNELKYAKTKVIDSALKYGYESPVSFARAFKSFHGINPGESTTGPLKQFPKLFFGISVKAVMEAIRKDTLTIEGKDYEASYFGELDMSNWSEYAKKREYWRLENAGNDFKDRYLLNQVLPYNNYPPMDIQKGQVFVVDYHKFDGTVERKYYIADGTVWQDLPSTREFLLRGISPIRIDTLNVADREYEASYFGDQDMSYWSDYATKREFWRLENIGNEFADCKKLEEVLPYNNYPPISFQIGQVFVIDYHTRSGGIERRYFIVDGTVWQDMPSTRRFLPN